MKTLAEIIHEDTGLTGDKLMFATFLAGAASAKKYGHDEAYKHLKARAVETLGKIRGRD